MLKSFFGFIVVAVVLANTSSVYSQAIVSAQSGPWNDVNTWSGGVIPTAANSTSISVNHNINIPNGYSVTIDETVVAVGATLTVNNGGTLTINNSVNALVVNGTLTAQNGSSITGTTGFNVSFASGAVYRHQFTTTEGSIPLASWNANSTVIIEGYTNYTTASAAGNWSQSFGNVIYNCTAQQSTIVFNLAGRLNFVAGDLTISSTGAGHLLFTNAETSTLFIAGSLSITGTSRVRMTNAGDATFTISGDFSQSGGLLTTAVSSGQGTLNINGDFSLTAGTITETATGTSGGNINFTGNNLHQYVNTGTISNTQNWYIGPNETVNLGTYPIKSGAASTFTLDGTIIVGSTAPGGAIYNSLTAGNIQTATNPGNRIYNSGSTVIYRSTSPQSMGNGQPTAAGVTTVIDNNQGVTLASNIVIGGTLDLTAGELFISSRTLTLNGTLTTSAGFLGGNSTSVLNIGGTTGGSLGTLVFGINNTVGILTLNRTGAGASVTLNSTLNIAQQFNLTSGDFNNLTGLTFANNVAVTRFAASNLLSNRPIVNPGDSYNIRYRTASTGTTGVRFTTGLELPLATSTDALNDFNVLLGTTYDTLDLSQNIYVNGIFDLNRGLLLGNNLTITMQGTLWQDDAGNFTSGTTGLVIFNSTTTIGGTSNVFFSNLRMTPTAVVTFTRNFNVSGDIDFQAGSSVTMAGITMTLFGSSAVQTLAGGNNSFHDITLQKSGGNVQLTSAVNLVGVLRFNTPTANCNFMSDGFLTLISTSDSTGSATAPGTAQIYRIQSLNQVSGDVIVQRFMSGEGRIYRYISSPVSNATVASWQDDFAITGTFDDPSTGRICGGNLIPTNPSLYYYDESVAGTQDQGYQPYPTSGTAASNPIQVGRGYAAFIRQCIVPTTIDVTGPINQGTITFPVTYTNTGNGVEDGYNLVGNPYPCTIDWDLSGWTKSRISPVISIRDNGNNGMMLYWDGDGDPNTLANGQIAPGQAFWVRATAAGPSLRATEAVKGIAPNQSGEFYRETPTSTMVISLTNSAGISDKAYIKVRSESTPRLDDWDAPKLKNELFDLYTMTEDQIKMAINATDQISCSAPIVLGTRNLAVGKWTLDLDLKGNFEDYNYILHDNFAKQSHAFNGKYEFSVTSDVMSAAADRFTISLEPKANAANIEAEYVKHLCEIVSTPIQISKTVRGVEYQLFSGDKEIASVPGTGGVASIQVPASNITDGSNSFSIRSVSACGTQLASENITITVGNRLAGIRPVNGSSCGPGKVVLKLENVPADYSVKWFSTESSENILATGAIFETSLLNKSSTYFAVTEGDGCRSERLPVKAEIVHTGSPSITVDTDKLILNGIDPSGQAEIQWLFNNEVIPNALSYDLTPQHSGVYSAIIQINGCRVRVDQEFFRNTAEGMPVVTVFPNPIGASFNIGLQGNIDQIESVYAISNTGVKIPLERDNSSRNTVMTDGLSSGFYILEITVNRSKYYQKVFKN